MRATDEEWLQKWLSAPASGIVGQVRRILHFRGVDGVAEKGNSIDRNMYFDSCCGWR